MRILKNTLALCGLLFALTTQSQTTQDSLDLWRDIDTYHQLNKRLDYDGILNFMPPKMFTVVPKSMMKNALENAFENEQFRVSIDTMIYKSMLPLVKIGNQICTMVHYDIGMSMAFIGEQDSAFLNMMTEIFAAKYGAENVRVSSENGAKVEIKALGKKMFALKEPTWDTWKFMEDKRGEADENQQKMLEMVIPKEVLDYFK